MAGTGHWRVRAALAACAPSQPHTFVWMGSNALPLPTLSAPACPRDRTPHPCLCGCPRPHGSCADPESDFHQGFPSGSISTLTEANLASYVGPSRVETLFMKGLACMQGTRNATPWTVRVKPVGRSPLCCPLAQPRALAGDTRRLRHCTTVPPCRRTATRPRRHAMGRPTLTPAPGACGLHDTPLCRAHPCVPACNVTILFECPAWCTQKTSTLQVRSGYGSVIRPFCPPGMRLCGGGRCSTLPACHTTAGRGHPVRHAHTQRPSLYALQDSVLACSLTACTDDLEILEVRLPSGI